MGEWSHAEKVAARQAVNVEVAAGRMPRPNDLPCTDCHQNWVPGLSRHEYDHHKGYAVENWLEVEPVCSKCHKKRDSPKVAQTACVHGHPYTPENTIIKPNGCRRCRECRRAYDRNRRDAAYWRTYRVERKARRG